MPINHATDILGLVDVQPTFMPGGELAVENGHLVLPVLNLIQDHFDHAFATQDWHPAGHASFASSHPGAAPFSEIDLPYGRQTLWPDHALIGSPNAAIHADLRQDKVELIIRKGFHANLDSYSAFFENDRTTPTGLDGWLRQRGFRHLYLGGIATDFCVAWSAEDAIQLGYQVTVIDDACRGIGIPTTPGRTTMLDTRDRLLRLGVRFIDSSALAD